MRYIILGLLAVFSVILNGSLLSTLPFWGIQADIIILAALALSLAERTSMPVIFALIAGLLADILYSPVIGFFALGYTITAGVACTVLSRFERINILTVLIAGAAGGFLFELICTAEAYLLGARFSVRTLFAEHILPQTIFTAIALLAAYQLISRMMRPAYMKPKIKENKSGSSFNAQRQSAPHNW